jgi:hypothetical protein
MHSSDAPLEMMGWHCACRDDKPWFLCRSVSLHSTFSWVFGWRHSIVDSGQGEFQEPIYEFVGAGSNLSVLVTNLFFRHERCAKTGWDKGVVRKLQ